VWLPHAKRVKAFNDETDPRVLNRCQSRAPANALAGACSGLLLRARATAPWLMPAKFFHLATNRARVDENSVMQVNVPREGWIGMLQALWILRPLIIRTAQAGEDGGIIKDAPASLGCG
jgi:hypothetical protein